MSLWSNSVDVVVIIFLPTHASLCGSELTFVWFPMVVIHSICGIGLVLPIPADVISLLCQ